jgi:hypothetical protein
MHTSSRPNTLSWLVHLATRLLARSLNMPEPLVYNTGVFVFARVQAVETSIGRTLCPVRIWRVLLARIQLWQDPPR